MGRLVAVLLIFVAGRASALDLTGTLWDREASRYGIDPYLLYALALCESGRYVGRGMVRPWPWAIGLPGQPLYPDSREQAEKKLDELIEKGETNIGVGLMQISVKYHADKVERLADLLEPSVNIALGARILYKALMRFPEDTLRGLGAYYSSEPDKALPYARRVLSVARWLNQIHILHEGGRRVVAR